MRSVSLVGGAKTTRELYKRHHADEVWTLAYLHDEIDADLLFEMHQEEDMPPERGEFVVLRDDLRIMTLDSYPKEVVIDDLFRNLPVDYLFASTFDYMMGLAIFQQYDRIQIFGFEMEMTTEWFYQRPGAYLMMGIAAGRGIDVYVPEESKLIRPQLYGYEGIPVISHEVVKRLDWIKDSYGE